MKFRSGFSKGIVQLILLPLYLLASSNSFSQSNELLKRDSFQLKVAVDDEYFYQDEIKSAPYILPENTIQIYPGEQLFMEVELKGKEIKSMKAVKENLNPKKTIILTFSQMTEGRVHKSMLLKVENPFDYKLTYRAHMYLMQQKKWASTNVFPVLPKLSGFETWPDIILTLGLDGWSFE